MNFRDLVQSLLFYVGIPAFTLYPLGFAALAIQLWNDPLFPYYDFDTVWYAVTLVPKNRGRGHRPEAHIYFPGGHGGGREHRLAGRSVRAPQAWA